MRERDWERLRNGVLFLTGLGGVIYMRLTNAPGPEPYLIIFAAMMGLPAVLGRIPASDYNQMKEERDRALALLEQGEDVAQRAVEAGEKKSHGSVSTRRTVS